MREQTYSLPDYQIALAEMQPLQEVVVDLLCWLNYQAGLLPKPSQDEQGRISRIRELDLDALDRRVVEVVKDPNTVKWVSEAYVHDTTHYDDLLNGTVAYSIGSKEGHQAVQDLFAYIYSKFPGLTTAAKTYPGIRTVVGLFRLRFHVCPCCQLDYIYGKHEVVPDHLLPKSFYPHLFLFPFNLVPTCSECNTGKGDKFIGLSGDGPALVPLLHPASNIAFDWFTCSVHFERGKYTADLEVNQERVQALRPDLFGHLENFMSLFDLRTRYLEVHPRVKDLFDDLVKTCARSYVRQVGVPQLDILREHVGDFLQDRRTHEFQEPSTGFQRLLRRGLLTALTQGQLGSEFINQVMTELGIPRQNLQQGDLEEAL
jgi:hypothetical protein